MVPLSILPKQQLFTCPRQKWLAEESPKHCSVQEMQSWCGARSLKNSHVSLFVLCGYPVSDTWLISHFCRPSFVFIFTIDFDTEIREALCCRHALTHAVSSEHTFLSPSLLELIRFAFWDECPFQPRLFLSNKYCFKKAIIHSWRQKDAGTLRFASQTMGLLQEIKAKQCLLPNLSYRSKTQTTILHFSPRIV